MPPQSSTTSAAIRTLYFDNSYQRMRALPKYTVYIKKYFMAIVEIHLSLYVPFQLWKFQIFFSI